MQSDEAGEEYDDGDQYGSDLDGVDNGYLDIATQEYQQEQQPIQELQPLPTPNVNHYTQEPVENNNDELKYDAFSEEIGASDGEIINNLSCCLSFLLDEKSPLWKKNKWTHSIQPSIDLGNNNKKRGEFQKRCSNWQSDYKIDLKELPHAQHAEMALNTLPKTDGRQERWPKLMQFWDSWEKNEKLDEDYKIDKLDWKKEDIDAIKSYIDMLVEKQPLAPIASNESKPNLSKAVSVNLAAISGKAVENINDDRLNELQNVKYKIDMENWLKKYKLVGMKKEEKEFNAIDAFEEFGEDVRDVGSSLFSAIVGYKIEDDFDLQLSIQMAQRPMRRWKWIHVVQWIEKKDNLKQFTGIFYEWRINGDELLLMNNHQFDLLIKCCCCTTSTQLQFKHLFNKENIKILITEIWKCLIETTITFQYDLYWNTLNQIKENQDHEYFETAWKIFDLITFLRPTYNQGPKAIWKLNAFYFSKIDNILSLLIVNGICKKLFQDCFPRYIFDDQSQHLYQQTRLQSMRISNINSIQLPLKQSIQEQYDYDDDDKKNDDERTDTSLMTDAVKKENDILDKFADCCCGDGSRCGNICGNCCFEFLHSFDRIYCGVIILLLTCISICCLITWFWMSYRSRFEIDIAMDWVSQSIADRAIQNLEYEFFLPQMILSMSVTGLFAGDIPLNVIDFNNGKYDRFWIQFEKYRATKGSIYALYMIETDNNTMTGAYMSNVSDLNNGEILISSYDGRTGQGIDCFYDFDIEKRDCSKNNITYNDYDPTIRDWYKIGINESNGFIGWSKPYQFIEGPYGLSLIQSVDILNNNDNTTTRVIFLCEFTINSLKQVINEIGNIDGGITMVMTSDGSVVGSSIGQFDLNIKNCINCSANNKYIKDCADKLRDNPTLLYNNITTTKYKKINSFSNDYTAILFSFKTVYIIPSNDNQNEEYGSIVVIYDNSHLNEIKWAEKLSMFLYLISIILPIILICFMGKYLQKKQNETEEEEIERQSTQNNMVDDPSMISKIEIGFEENKIFLVDGTCICDHKSLLLCSFWYSMIIFIATFYIWYSSISNTLDDSLDIFLNEEYLIIQDKTVSYITVAESIADIVEERFNRGDMNNIIINDTFSKDLDIFFTNLMNTFKFANGDYYADYVFLGFPDGKFIGAKVNSNNSQFAEPLLLGIRDGSFPPNCDEKFETNVNSDVCKPYNYYFYPINDNTFSRIDTKASLASSVNSYDPRCRPWYNQSLGFMFNGNIENAFGGIDNFNDFYYPEIIRSADLNSDCIDMREYYLSIWKIDVEDILNTTTTTNIGISELGDNINSVYLKNIEKNFSYTCDLELNNKKEQLPEYDIIFTKYVFSSNEQTGLTASKPIIDNKTGKVLAIMAIDFTLQGLSQGLNQTNNYGIGEKDWISWIFDGNGFDNVDDINNIENIYATTDMIASSEGQVMQTLTDGETELVPYLATSHNNEQITIDSKQIINNYPKQCGSENVALPINTTISGSFVDLPIDNPELLAGRLRSYPWGNNDVEINWIIAKSIDIDNFKTQDEDDSKIIFFVILCTLLAIWVIQSSINIGHVKKDINDGQNREENREMIENDNGEARKTKKYGKLRDEMEDIIEGSSSEIWGIFLDEYFNDNESSINGILTTDMAQDFMAKESNKHISSEEDDDLTILLSTLQLQKKWTAFRILSTINSKRYNIFITFILCLHVLTSIQIPETPSALKNNKFNNPISAATLSVIYILITIEIIDLILQTIARYIQFGVVNKKNLLSLVKLKFGFKHKFVKQIKNKSILWLIFFGTKYYNIYLLQILLTILIIINTTLMTTIQIGPFEYYLPIIPILLAIRSYEIRKFSIQLFYAVYLAKDVLVSYIFLITVVAIFGESIFRDILRSDESTDTFSSTIRAWITSFVFVSTGENYNEVVYSALLNSDQLNQSQSLTQATDQTWSGANLMFFIIIAVIGLYFFIPIIIHKFETAFDHSRDEQNNKQEKTRINSIIASFIMLDMNDDGNISVNEFQHLIHSSIISRDILNEAFNASLNENDNENEISLFEFVKTLSNRSSLQSVIVGVECNNNKIQSYLECNWFRKPKNRFYTLVYVIIPSVCISLIRGLSGIDSLFPEIMISLSFIYNFIDINLRCYAFGRRRYAFLNKFENPPLVKQAISNWRIKKGIIYDNIDIHQEEITNLFVKLSHIEKQWVSLKLHDTQPMSHWEKKTMSLVHRFELYTIWTGLIGWIITFILPNYTLGYRYVFLQLYLLRLFTLIESNQKLIVLIFTIVPHFLNLLAFAFIFIFIWARIGCTLFNGKKEFVLNEVYETSANASFDTMGLSILTLLQLMIGEGWHEIMYLNMIATRVEYAMYFIFYIVFVTLIISNIFIGLFLSEIEELDNEQSQDQLLSQWRDGHHNFNQIAIERKKKLINKLNNLQHAAKDTQKQIERINKLLKDNNNNGNNNNNNNNNNEQRQFDV